MKSAAISLLISFSICTIYAKSQQNHAVTFGAPGSSEIFLHREIISKKAKVLRIVSTDYEFKQKPDNLPLPPRTITRIVVSDPSGSDAGAKLIGGGPGTFDATLHLKSKRSEHIHLVIDIFGQ